MDRSLQQRIEKVEKLLSKAEESVSLALKKRAEWYAELADRKRPEALAHATAVAALVLYGEPKIDEPLRWAWVRTLHHYGITIKDGYGRIYKSEHEHEYNDEDGDYEYDYEYDYKSELMIAHPQLYPAIMKDANETEKFTEIFRTAPIWLLEFTWMRLDASFLKFDLPEMSNKQVWGEEGLKQFLRWPRLPRGMMTDGDLVADVVLEKQVSPADEEEYRQNRRIKDFIARDDPRHTNCKP